jgi:hypothetical protein
METRRSTMDLSRYLDGETAEFTVKSEHLMPLREAAPILGFGAVWTIFTLFMVSLFIGPVLAGREVHFKSNGVPVTAGPNNMGPLAMPGAILGIFVLVGFGMTGYGVYMITAEGPRVAGTSKRLLVVSARSTRSIDWEQFTGDIEVRGNQSKGDITLVMRTGQMVQRKNSPPRYVPDKITLVGIPDPYNVEAVCRRRIKENDPTPPTPSSAGPGALPNDPDGILPRSF